MDEPDPNKQRRGWWPCKRARSNSDDDEVLLLPNFLADANKLVDILDIKEGNLLDEEKRSKEAREHIVNGLIDARIGSLTGIFRTRYSSHCQTTHDHNDRPPIRTRATDMTDTELADWVLKGACSESFLRPKRGKRDKKIFNEEEQEKNDCESNTKSSSDTNKRDHVMNQIAQQYKSRREEQRSMAKILHATLRRHMLGMPQQRDDSAVRIDRYGRLVHVRNGSLNGREEQRPNNDENGGGDSNNGNDQAEDVELEDGSETFWRHYSMAEARRRNESSGINRENRQHNPPAAQPLPPIVNQPMRIRDISRQMERDACSAIQRALDRYKLQEEQSNRCQTTTTETADPQEFELIPIPLLDPMDENDPHRQTLPQLNQQQQENERDHDRENGNRQEQRNRRGFRNGENWLDLRLAFRRICCAVITVTAAFICMMIQGTPLNLRDDTRLDIDGLWLSGLMGPHFHGHHRTSPAVRANTHAYPEEDDVADEDPSPFAMFRSKKAPSVLPTDDDVAPDTDSNLQQYEFVANSNIIDGEESEGWKRAENLLSHACEHDYGIGNDNVYGNEGEMGSCQPV